MYEFEVEAMLATVTGASSNLHETAPRKRQEKIQQLPVLAV